jgi:hypothetical protein
MKKTLSLSSVITLLALISLLAQAFTGPKEGIDISAPVIGIAGISIILILAFAFSREDHKNNHKQEE